MNLRIVPFDPALRSHVGRLNREWLERYFVVEPIDADVLDHPEQRILDIVKKKVQRRDKSAENRAVIADYLAALASDLAGLKLGEIDVAASDTRREPLQLADVYVPLATHLRLPAHTTLAQWLEGGFFSR